MQVSNIQYYRNNFEAYNTMTGYSYSGITKSASFKPSEKMRLGTAVHNYLLEPETYNHENREIVIPLANAVRAELGALLPFLDTELSVSADFEYGGLIMPYKGRVDMVRTGKIVLDLKVSEIPLRNSVPYFGYDRQVNGYMAATMSELGMIIRIDPKNARVEKKMIPKDHTWWIDQIHRFGIPKEIY
jgi:hypothetical protein